MKNSLFLLMMVVLIQCQAQVSFNYECGNAPPVNRDDKWGTLYWNQEIRIPFIYNKIEGLKGQGMYIAYLNEKAGLIDCDGKEIIPFEYAYIKNWLSPFGEQEGFYVVSKKKQTAFGMDENNKEVINDWGLIDRDNKTIVPLEYGYVRVIDADLIVARKDRDTILYFFSSTGNLLYKQSGKHVMPGFDDNSLKIEQFRGKLGKHIYKSGEEILPEKYGYCYWAGDGKYIIKRNDQSIVIDKTGKQLSPSGFSRLIHKEGDEFFFNYADSESHEMGVYRIGEGIILEPKYFLSKWGEFYIASNESGASMEFLDKNGKTLLPMKEYWTSSSNNRLDLKYKADYKMKFDDFYQVVLDKQTSLSGLINKDGEIVLPLEFRTIKYAWKGHPIIASTEAGYNAYDSNGKKLLHKDFLFIEHTKDPTIIIVGKKDENYNDFTALVDLTEPENIDYKYEELSNLGGNYLMVRDGDSTESYIINYQGIALGNFKYKSITMPDYREFERFMRTPGTNGNLIAVGQVDRKYFAINDKGETFELVD